MPRRILSLMLFSFVWIGLFVMSLLHSFTVFSQDYPSYTSQRLGLGNVGQAKWSPDGSAIAVGCEDGIRIFDSNLQLLDFVEIAVPNDILNSFLLSWSPDASYLAAATTLLDQNWIQIWNTSDYSPFGTILVESFNPFSLFVWSPDSTQIALSDMSDLQIWDISASPQLTTTFTGHTDIIVDISWNPSQSSQIATAAVDTTVKIWNVTTESLENDYTVQYSPQSIAWNPQASQIALSNDTQLEIRDVPSWNLSTNLTGHTESIFDISWSIFGLASTSYHGPVIIWDLITRQPDKTLQGHTDLMTSIDWQPTGNKIVTSGDSTIRTWNVATGNQEAIYSSFNSVIYSISWQQSGNQIVSSSRDSRVQIWEAATGNFVDEISIAVESVKAVAWSPDENLIAVGSYDGSLSIWDATNLTQSLPLITIPNTSPDVGFSYLAWNPDSQRVAAPTVGNGIAVWDASTGATLETLSAHTSVVVTVAWSPDGSMLASVGRDGSVIVWDNLYQPSTILENIDVSNPDIAWNKDSNQLAVSSEQTIYVVNAQTGQVLHHLEIDDSSRSVAWEPSDTLAIGTRQGKIYLWDDVSNPVPLTIIDAHTDNITDLAWASDGVRLASSGWDYKIQVWEPITNSN